MCETQHPILLEPITFAEAVVSQRIEPESSADKDKLANVLNKLQREDPTFVVKTDKDTGQMLMSGMGTLHLEVKRHRMERDFRLKIRVGKPQVSYRETLRSRVTIEGECDRDDRRQERLRPGEGRVHAAQGRTAGHGDEQAEAERDRRRRSRT